MDLLVDAELRALCVEIAAWTQHEPEWREMEASDMFQTDHYCGGWEADEEAFTFSHYDAEGHERWFSLTLDEVGAAAAGRLETVVAREPQ